MNKTQFKKNRLKLGLTQEQLATKLHIHCQHVSKIERGVRNPSWRLVKDFKELIDGI